MDETPDGSQLPPYEERRHAVREEHDGFRDDHEILRGEMRSIRVDLQVHVHPELESLSRSIHGPIIDEALMLRDHEKGMEFMVGELYDKATNGGMLATLSTRDRQSLEALEVREAAKAANRAKVVVATISAVALVLAAFVTATISLIQVLSNYQELSDIVTGL